MSSNVRLTPFRLAPALLEEVRAFAADNEISANAAVARLLRAGLDAEDRAFIERHGARIRAEVDKTLAARGLSDTAP